MAAAEHVKMIGHSADFQCAYIIRASDSANIGPEIVLDFVADQGATSFG